jgi:hypothetical protein
MRISDIIRPLAGLGLIIGGVEESAIVRGVDWIARALFLRETWLFLLAMAGGMNFHSLIQYLLLAVGVSLLVPRGWWASAWTAVTRRRAAKEQPEGDASASGPIAAAPPIPPPIWNARGLYVGDITASTDKLTSDLFVEITVKVFNGTGSSLETLRIEGAATFASVVLPAAQATPFPGAPQYFGNFAEFYIIIRQPFRREQAEQLDEMIKSGVSPQLHLGSLNVIMAPRDHPQRERLRLWDGIVFNSGIGRVGRLISMNVRESVSAEDSMA